MSVCIIDPPVLSDINTLNYIFASQEFTIHSAPLQPMADLANFFSETARRHLGIELTEQLKYVSFIQYVLKEMVV